MKRRKISPALKLYYRRIRKHQINTYGNSGLHIGGVDQRQFTGGSAAYGFHAYQAWNSARAEIHFRERMKEYVR